jgi:hypothetical protein
MAAALGARRFRGGEGAEAVEWGGGSIYCAVEEADGRGAAGNGAGVRRPTAARGRRGRGRRWETAPTGGPHLSVAV